MIGNSTSSNELIRRKVSKTFQFFQPVGLGNEKLKSEFKKRSSSYDSTHTQKKIPPKLPKRTFGIDHFYPEFEEKKEKKNENKELVKIIGRKKKSTSCSTIKP